MFQENILLSRYSNYKIGGPAKYFFEARKIEDVIKAAEKARRLKLPIFVLGGGTNVLFSDEGFEGLILKPDLQFIKQEGNFVKVGAGVLITELLNNLITKNLAGLEWAAGLPGTLGGAIRGNAGSFGGEIKDIIGEVVSLDISGLQPKVIKRRRSACKFNYRSSIFKLKKRKEIILEATLILKRGDKKLIKKIMEKNINYRKQTQPLEYPSLGSTFKNVPLKQVNAKGKQINVDVKKIIKTDPFPVIPAAYLISESGLKGVSIGGAMISPKHPNFIVNVLGATANDVKSLILLAKNKVYKKFKIHLEEEIEYL